MDWLATWMLLSEGHVFSGVCPPHSQGHIEGGNMEPRESR